MTEAREAILAGRSAPKSDKARIAELEAENAKLRAFKEACEKEEPVAKVYDPYDTPGIHWHCNTPPYSGMPLYTHPLAAEQIRKEERERILKIFEAQDIDPAFKNRILEQLVEPLS
ncbi:MAG: hypothetical protein KGL39_36155 [Patescibacteria group bacterium]|nr:hypothetical protein [Patescibacteria group bacterium]